MTPKEMYDLLDKAEIDYEVVEIFEGVRIVRILVDEETDHDD
jgi:UTP-glucose-1-phosphate uridylyltransferase